MILGARRRGAMLEDLEFDDGDTPAIGLVPPGVTWEEVHDHIKIAHHHLLVLRSRRGLHWRLLDRPGDGPGQRPRP